MKNNPTPESSPLKTFRVRRRSDSGSVWYIIERRFLWIFWKQIEAVFEGGRREAELIMKEYYE